MAAVRGSIADLPPEVLHQVFSYLDTADHYNVESVCVQWSRIIVGNFWRHHVAKVAGLDANFAAILEAEGWSFDYDDHRFIRMVYLKLRGKIRWRHPPKVRERVFLQCSPEENGQIKVSSCVVYKNKIFVSLVGGTVQSRALDSFEVVNTLVNMPVSNSPFNEPTLLLTSPIAVHGNTLVTTDHEEKCLHLWNADTEEKTTRLRLPDSIHKVYDVRINATHIICLASWSLVAWYFDSAGNLGFTTNVLSVPQVVFDFHDEPVNDTNAWFETHGIEMNSQYVVTHATQPLINVRSSPRRSVSFLHCRRLIMGKGVIGPSIRPKSSTLNNMEIDRIKISSAKYNLLALMQLDEESSSLYYIIQIMSVKSGDVVVSLFPTSSIFSEVRLPIQWVDNKLYLKVVPKSTYMTAYNDKNDDLEVSLSMWDCETNEETFAEGVKLFTMADHVMVDNTHVVQIYQRFPRAVAINEPDLRYIVCGKVYDFWTNRG
jgi:hypothetical protein